MKDYDSYRKDRFYLPKNFMFDLTTSDRYTIGQSRYNLMIGNYSRVLDLGANIGAFIAWAKYRAPECHIVAIEPNTHLMTQLQHNAKLFNGVKVIEGAAVVNANKFVNLFSTHSKMSASLYPLKDSTVYKTRAIDVRPLIENHDVVKIDVECYEYEIILACDFSNVRSLAVEFHFRLREHDGLIYDCVDRLKSFGLLTKKRVKKYDFNKYRSSAYTRYSTFIFNRL